MPEITTRAAWGANPLHTPADTIAVPAPNLWLHHTASTGLHGAAGMRSLQAGALAGGYSDVEYTFVVDTDGAIYEARGPGRNSAAQGCGGNSNNSYAHALCAMGNYETQQPTEPLIDSLAWCVRYLFNGGWSAQARITGPHRDAPACSTACCGTHLIARIGDINARAGGSTGGGSAPAPGGDDDMPADKDVVDQLVTAEGTWQLQFDGGVKTIRGPFYGSYFTLPANVRNDPARRFRTLSAPSDGSARGYDLVSTKGERYAMRTKS